MKLRRLCVAAAVCGLVVSAAAADLAITAIARDDQVLVSFELSEGLSAEVMDAIQSGLPTTFSYQIELKRAAAFFDRTIAAVTVAATVRFDNLTRRYQMSRSLDGRVDEMRPTEDRDAVRAWLTRFERVPVSATSALEPNGEYYVRVRANARPRGSWFVWPWDPGSILGRVKFTFLP